jgi:hypothetical protein
MTTIKEEIQSKLLVRKKYSALSKENRCLEYSKVFKFKLVPRKDSFVLQRKHFERRANS